MKHLIRPPEDRIDTYRFSVEIPEHSRLHPDNEDYSLEPELPDHSRRRFLKGVALGGALSAGGVAAGGHIERAQRSAYEEAVAQAEDLVSDVRYAKRNGTDRASVFLGNVNEYGYDAVNFGIGDDAPGDWLGPVDEHDVLLGLLEDDDLTVELVYLDEPLDKEAFLARLMKDQLNFVENMDRFYEQPDMPLGSSSPLQAGADRDTVIDFFQHYYRELMEELEAAYRHGDGYLDRAADSIDRDILHQTGERIVDEAQAAAPHDVGLEYSIRVEPLRPRENLDQKKSTLLDEYREDRNTFPVFLTTRDMGYGADGYGTPTHAMVHLPLPLLLEDERVDGTVIGRGFLDITLMEVGHGIYRLPHTAGRHDSMSYNKEYRVQAWLNGTIPGYGAMTQALVDRYVSGDLWEREGGTQYRPGSVDERRASDLFDRNLYTFFTDMIGFPVDDWQHAFDPDQETAAFTRDEEQGVVTATASIDSYITDISMGTDPQ